MVRVRAVARVRVRAVARVRVRLVLVLVLCCLLLVFVANFSGAPHYIKSEIV